MKEARQFFRRIVDPSLKPAILDGQFDYKQPEILVCNKDEKGKFTS